MLGKIINGKFIPGKQQYRRIEVNEETGEQCIIFPTDEELVEQGCKELVTTPLVKDSPYSMYIPIYSEENEKIVRNWLLMPRPSYEAELQAINKWLSDNDWKVNKIVTGEWETTDDRWLSYLTERVTKRSRRDELLALLENEK